MFNDAFKEFERDPFFNFGSSPFHGNSPPGATADPFSRQNQTQMEPSRRQPNDSHAIVPRNRQMDASADRRRHSDTMALPGFTFGQHFDQIFDSMNRMMQEATNRMSEMERASTREDFNGRMYSHSSVYSYRNSGKDAPHIYQAMSEAKAGPGGVRETRKALKDSRANEEKMAVGHHIGAKGHTVERRRNTRSGATHEDHQFSGIDETEGPKFDNEWHSRAPAALASTQRQESRHEGRRLGNRPTGNRRAIGYSKQ